MSYAFEKLKELAAMGMCEHFYEIGDRVCSKCGYPFSSAVSEFKKLDRRKAFRNGDTRVHKQGIRRA